MLGHDPAGLGAKPSFQLAATRAVLLPNRIPDQLGDPLLSCLGRLADVDRVDRVELDLPGSLETSRMLTRKRDEDGQAPEHVHHEPDHDHEADHEHDADHDDDDMMAITGEPSADGLVMEPIDLRCGPLAMPFPGGLVIEATLDGAVVSEASIGGLELPTSAIDDPPLVPDPLAPSAWAVAIARAGGSEEGWDYSSVFAVELERAVSHLAWIRSLSRLLGWRRMTNHAATALAELAAIGPRSAVPSEDVVEVDVCLDAGAMAISRLLDLLSASRTVGWRLAGRGVVERERALSLGLQGPNARASGLVGDARTDEPIYAELDFESLHEQDGDAAARTRLRAREAGQSVGLARAALLTERTGTEAPPSPSAAGSVEGPRGALRATSGSSGWTFEVEGASGAISLAAECMRGESWEDALVVVASFDLSPWGNAT